MNIPDLVLVAVACIAVVGAAALICRVPNMKGDPVQPMGYGPADDLPTTVIDCSPADLAGSTEEVPSWLTT